MDVGKLYIRLKEVADKKCLSDNEDFCVDEHVHGNVDNAYEGGYSDGEIRLARRLIKEFFPDRKKDEP